MNVLELAIFSGEVALHLSAIFIAFQVLMACLRSIRREVFPSVLLLDFRSVLTVAGWTAGALLSATVAVFFALLLVGAAS